MVRPDLPELPKRFKKLPVNGKGYPVPKFVATVDGKYDFRCITPAWRIDCYNKSWCWLCGEPLGRHRWFVIGPMCVVNRVTSEPPSHWDCADFATRACPFMLSPMAKRNERDLPEDRHIPGQHVDRNPGTFAMVKSSKYKPFKTGDGSFLFRIVNMDEVLWRREGREATREEAIEAMESGLPLLYAEAVKDGRNAVAALRSDVKQAQKYLPGAS